MTSCGLIVLRGATYGERNLAILVGRVIERAVWLYVHQAHVQRFGHSSASEAICSRTEASISAGESGDSTRPKFARSG